MSTSALIKIVQFNIVNVYKHYDGYPDGTLPWLQDFTADFLNKRGIDPEYFMAQLLRSSVRDSEKYQLDDSLHTGWGLMAASEEIGVDYTYTIDLVKETIHINNGTLIELNPDKKKNEIDIKELLKEREIINEAHDEVWALVRDLDKAIIDSLTMIQYNKIIGKPGTWLEKIKRVSKSKKLLEFAKRNDCTRLELKSLSNQLKIIERGLDKLGYFKD